LFAKQSPVFGLDLTKLRTQCLAVGHVGPLDEILSFRPIAALPGGFELLTNGVNPHSVRRSQ
jgi:hypothetical protein